MASFPPMGASPNVEISSFSVNELKFSSSEGSSDGLERSLSNLVSTDSPFFRFGNHEDNYGPKYRPFTVM